MSSKQPRLFSAVFEFDVVEITFSFRSVIVEFRDCSPVRQVTINNDWQANDPERVNDVTCRRWKPRMSDCRELIALARQMMAEEDAAAAKATKRKTSRAGATE